MHLLEQAAVFLLTAVLLVPLFKRLKLGAVLGYLGAGMLIGPFGFGMIGEVESTLQFAEFGVVLLLFLVGLELQPSRLWVLRRPVFGLGGAQVLATGAVLAALALAFGFSWQAALVAGFGLAMSSTALVLASLAERKQLATRHGREAFAVLLFQDVSVIPLLALLPLLSDSGTHAAGGWMAAAKGLAVIAVVIVSSRLVVRPALKAVANRGGAAARGGRRADHGENRPVALARRLPRRGAPRRLRISPRAGSRHRALQGPAARSFLHRRWHEREPWSRLGAAPHGARPRVRPHVREACTDVRDRQDRRRAERHCAATCRFGFAGRRIRLRSVRRGREPRHIRGGHRAAPRGGRDRLDAASAARVRS